MDVFRQRIIEVIRDAEFPGRQAEGPGRMRNRGQGPRFGDRPALARDEEVLSGLDSVEQGGEVSLEVLQGRNPWIDCNPPDETGEGGATGDAAGG